MQITLEILLLFQFVCGCSISSTYWTRWPSDFERALPGQLLPGYCTCDAFNGHTFRVSQCTRDRSSESLQGCRHSIYNGQNLNILPALHNAMARGLCIFCGLTKRRSNATRGCACWVVSTIVSHLQLESNMDRNVVRQPLVPDF